ncbi:MAG: tRNA-binding protein [Chloroflexi bacterium]|nr:tRNA-binding protein [Chloroflexota bacterium]
MELSGRALVGTVRSAEPLAGARKAAYVLEIDFGPAGVKRSSAQITELYAPEDLVGTQVVALVDLAPKRIAGVVRECLVLGTQTTAGVVVLRPERRVEDGSEVF